MEALRFIPETSSFSLESNVEIPKIQNADDVLVEVHFAGLCGTDIHIKQVGSYLSIISTYNYHVNFHFQLSRSENSFYILQNLAKHFLEKYS